jgi:two-component system, cell cycle sensor histidine kinase and response regulator CckA
MAVRAFRVLAVDDEDGIRRFVDRVLRRAGYHTAIAADGPAAIEIAKAQGPFDLLLADVVMPGMSGDEVARRLRLLEPDLKVLYLTGHSDALFADRRVLWDQESFIEKPVTMNGLLEAVALAIFGEFRGIPRPMQG